MKLTGMLTFLLLTLVSVRSITNATSTEEWDFSGNEWSKCPTKEAKRAVHQMRHNFKGATSKQDILVNGKEISASLFELLSAYGEAVNRDDLDEELRIVCGQLHVRTAKALIDMLNTVFLLLLVAFIGFVTWVLILAAIGAVYYFFPATRELIHMLILLKAMKMFIK